MYLYLLGLVYTQTFTNFVSVIKPNEVMLYREIITVLFRDPHKKHQFTLWAKHKIFNAKLLLHKVAIGLEWVKDCDATVPPYV
jgi:hypothetical protein